MPCFEITALMFVQLSLNLKELDTPEELNPLKEALDRAKRRVDQSTGIREALEAEASTAINREKRYTP